MFGPGRNERSVSKDRPGKKKMDRSSPPKRSSQRNQSPALSSGNKKGQMWTTWNADDIPQAVVEKE